MKKIFLPFALVLAIAISCAQKFETWQIPKIVLHNFQKQQPHIDADWETEDSVYEATFKSGEDNISLLYNQAGDLLQTEKIIKTAAVPYEIKSYLAKNKKDQKITRAKKVSKENGVVNYEVILNRQHLTFSEEGKFMKVPNP